MSSDPDLGAQLEDYVSTLVRDGRYGSRDEVLREGVRLLEERERRLSEVDAALGRGLADADAGRVRPITDVGARLIAKYEEQVRAGTV